jgi:hypothetical protein
MSRLKLRRRGEDEDEDFLHAGFWSARLKLPRFVVTALSGCEGERRGGERRGGERRGGERRGGERRGGG